MASFDFTEAVEAQDLARFDEQFRALGSGDSAFPEVPDGNYDVLVEDAQLERSQSSGNPMLVWKLRIQSGRVTGIAPRHPPTPPYVRFSVYGG